MTAPPWTTPEMLRRFPAFARAVQRWQARQAEQRAVDGRTFAIAPRGA